MNSARPGLSLEEAGHAWLETAGAANTAHFGVASGARIFYYKLRDEIHDLLCSVERYDHERLALLQEFKNGQATAVAAVTTTVAPALSAAPPILAPAIAVTLCVIGRAGLRLVVSSSGRKYRRSACGSRDHSDLVLLV